MCASFGRLNSTSESPSRHVHTPAIRRRAKYPPLSDALGFFMTKAPHQDSGFPSTPTIALRWLLRLRWGAVVGQLATIGGVSLAFRLKMPVVPLASLVAVTVATNLGLARWMLAARPVSSEIVAAVLAFDTLSLGGLLYFTGGASNPFSVLFLVQITIAAVVLGLRYTMAIVGLSAGTYAILFFENVPLPGVEHMHHAGTSAFNLHLQGMFVAFTLAAGLIAYFVTQVSEALRERDAQLVRAQRSASLNERLASLSTLAAGAAHELGTPLATIAVAAKELERGVHHIAGADGLREDARLIRGQVDRCRDIVHRLSARSSGAPGEAAELIAVDQFIVQLRTRLDDPRIRRLDVRADGAQPILVPWRGLVQVLGSLIKNAFDATEEADSLVILTIETADRAARFSVVDHGHGILPEDLPRVGEPFFTTKSPRGGMGLGVFLARAFVDRLGGSLAISSDPRDGTRAVLDLPMGER
jgi:two-component system, sensor histidine kinase RegB